METHPVDDIGITLTTIGTFIEGGAEMRGAKTRFHSKVLRVDDGGSVNADGLGHHVRHNTGYSIHGEINAGLGVSSPFGASGGGHGIICSLFCFYQFHFVCVLQVVLVAEALSLGRHGLVFPMETFMSHFCLAALVAAGQSWMMSMVVVEAESFGSTSRTLCKSMAKLELAVLMPKKNLQQVC